ncbi:MAG: DUF481 domain-containing protein [Desulfuromonadales bacterium]|nr:DUF481 domain-containing protein [Desulfuromonadales bacterium]MDW7756664.1 DUF481 domain-containing protein [Desulfuromonadales bacterium]
MRFFKLLSVLAMLLLPVAGALAEDQKWSDEAELSYVDTSGNTEVTTLSAKNKLQATLTERILATWKLQALYGETDGEKTAESYMTELRGDYALSERLYTFGAAGWLQDKFAGIDSRYTFGLGIGYKFLDGPKHFLRGEAGLTYTMDEYTDGSSEEYLGGRLFGEYQYQFTEKNRFSQTLEYLPDFENSDNWLLNSETALIAALNSFLSMKTSYVVKYDNEPAPGSEKTDRILGVALVVNF